jgi:hypothetical protein
MLKNHLFCLWSTLTTFIVLTGCTTANPALESLEITLTADRVGDDSPVIDGVLDPGEWDHADIFYFEDGSELYIDQDGEYLYLAIRSILDEMIAGNVFLKNGDKISILHTSAALGTATYQSDAKSWRKIQDFEWCCRSRIENEPARKEIEIFFIQDGWLGINSFLGNENELEYKIHLSGSVQNLSVNFVSADNPDRIQVWPVGLTDGPAQLLKGEFTEIMEFSPEDWQNLEQLP